MSRLLSAFGTAAIAVGFICAPIAALVTFAVYVFLGPTRGQVVPAITAGLVLGMLAGVIVG